MKDISALILAILFVSFSLVSLLSAVRTPEATKSVLVNNQERVSELGLRVAFKK